MAMTKAEKAILTELKKELMLYKAFTRTPKVEPDVLPPEEWDTLNKGWVILLHAKDVTEGCTSKHNHNMWGNTHTTSKGAISLYSTELLALKALRNALELEFMKTVSSLDARILEIELESIKPKTSVEDVLPHS